MSGNKLNKLRHEKSIRETYEAISDNPNLTVAELAVIMNKSASAVYTAIRKLMANKQVNSKHAVNERNIPVLTYHVIGDEFKEAVKVDTSDFRNILGLQLYARFNKLDLNKIAQLLPNVKGKVVRLEDK